MGVFTGVKRYLLFIFETVMVEEIVLKELAKRALEAVVRSSKHTKIKSYSKEKEVADALSRHLTFVNQWSSELNFADLKHAKQTQKVFVPLDLYFQPTRVRMTDEERMEKFPLHTLFKHSPKHVALLGQVGSGKTTSLKYLCQSLLFNEGLFPNRICYPLVIKLNDFNGIIKESEVGKSLLFNAIIKVMGIQFDFQQLDEQAIENFKESVVINCLNENDFLLLLDGFDEIISQKRKEVVIAEFEKLASSVERSRIVLTSRSSDYKYALANTKVFEISPLSDEQIRTFAKRWLENDQEAEDFIAKIKRSPFYDTTMRPLTIAHLCALYERNKNIPEKPKTVYKKIVMLLLEDWNLQRNIHRVSKYAKFESDRKFEFLASLAYHLAVMNGSNSFDARDVRIVYNKIFEDFDLEKGEMLAVMGELESHNGLILQSGFQRFEFAHKSIQEYLSAEYLVKLPTIPNLRQNIIKLANEFAVAIAISSRPSEYFVEFVDTRAVPMKLPSHFIKSFVNRLLLEKVDFNKSATVGVATLSLYSLYIKGVKDEEHQLSIFYFDDLVREFELFIEEIFKRNDKRDFFRRYDIIEEVPSAEGQIICTLKLKGKVKKNEPAILYARKSFLT